MPFFFGVWAKLMRTKIPESLFDHPADRLRQMIVHDVIDIAEIKKDRQVIDDAVEGVHRPILGLNR